MLTLVLWLWPAHSIFQGLQRDQKKNHGVFYFMKVIFEYLARYGKKDLSAGTDPTRAGGAWPLLFQDLEVLLKHTISIKNNT